MNSEIIGCNDKNFNMLRLNTNSTINMDNARESDWTMGATNNVESGVYASSRGPNIPWQRYKGMLVLQLNWVTQRGLTNELASSSGTIGYAEP